VRFLDAWWRMSALALILLTWTVVAVWLVFLPMPWNFLGLAVWGGLMLACLV
jgi:hypothetical protein